MFLEGNIPSPLWPLSYWLLSCFIQAFHTRHCFWLIKDGLKSSRRPLNLCSFSWLTWGWDVCTPPYGNTTLNPHCCTVKWWIWHGIEDEIQSDILTIQQLSTKSDCILPDFGHNYLACEILLGECPAKRQRDVSFADSFSALAHAPSR